MLKIHRKTVDIYYKKGYNINRVIHVGFISARRHKKKIQRLYFHGRRDENIIVSALIGGEQLDDSVSFAPDPYLIGRIKLELPDVQFSEEVEKWYIQNLERETKIVQSMKGSNYFEDGLNFIDKAKRVILNDSFNLPYEELIARQSSLWDRVLVITSQPKKQIWEKFLSHYRSVLPFKKKNLNGLIESKEVVTVATVEQAQDIDYIYVLTSVWDLVVIDECQTISGHNDPLFQIAKQLSVAENLILIDISKNILTDPKHLYLLLHLLDERRWSSQKAFVKLTTRFDGTTDFATLLQATESVLLSRIHIYNDVDSTKIHKIGVKLQKDHQEIVEKYNKGNPILESELINFPESAGFESFEPKTEHILYLVHQALAANIKCVVVIRNTYYLRHIAMILKSRFGKVSTTLSTPFAPESVLLSIIDDFNKTQEGVIVTTPKFFDKIDNESENIIYIYIDVPEVYVPNSVVYRIFGKNTSEEER